MLERIFIWKIIHIELEGRYNNTPKQSPEKIQ